MKDILKTTFEENIARVESLVAVYQAHPDATGRGRKAAPVLDILRAAVVLLHASLEDLLRGIATWKLPQAGKAVLDEIPLVGTGPNARKLSLGDLTMHRGRSIDEVIAASVDEHLLRSNYNSTREIASLMQSVGVDPTKVNARFSGLEDLMKRRHQIVHRADRQSTVKGSGDHRVRAINRQTVESWISDARQFVNDALSQL